MSRARVATFIGVGTLLAAWLASAIGVPRQARSPVSPPRSTEDAQIAALASHVQSQASRLRQRLASAPDLEPPARNPFTFAARNVKEPRRIAPPPLSTLDPLAEAVPAEPELALIGIAEDQTPAGVVRTAMILGEADQLHMVRQGQAVGAYEVVAIGPDAVELKDIASGVVRRLALR